MLFLTPEQERQQQQEEAKQRIDPDGYCPVFAMPLLIVESLSVGHEDHDHVTKRAWYEKAGVPHYWLLTPHERSLVCLRLPDKVYIEEASGRDADSVRPAIFGGVSIPLAELWA
jgi:Uma2 family endonuclease